MLGYANPWEARKEIGYFKALWETVKEVCLKPAEFFENLEIKDKYSDKPIMRYHFVTGGWSGNESVIRAIKSNMWLSCAWRMSTNSGSHLFEVPIASEAKL